MRRITLGLVLAVVAIVPARAVAATAIVDIAAVPNPAVVGDKVVHTVRLGAYARLDVWVNAQGFDQPRLGTLPAGRWRLECCPTMTGGAPAWHYRSSSVASPSTYRFRARARARGTHASTAAAGSNLDVVWVRIA